MRRLFAAFILGLLTLLPTASALAHGFGQRYTLPVPLWLYLYGAAAAVVLSFVLVVFFVGEGHAPHRYPRYNLLRLRWFRAIFASRPLLTGQRFLSVALFVLVILTGFLGDQTPSFNFAPTFVWVVWWVGIVLVVALAGNIWPLVNPWKVLFEWADGLARRLGLGDGPALHEPYPARWGIWPALLLYFVFVWVEIVFEYSAVPLNLAFVAVVYSVITWAGMAFFGMETWLRQGEAFSVFFGILARFAPTEVRVTDPEICRECAADCRVCEGDCVNCYECFVWAELEHRELNVRPWAVGLSQPEPITFDRLAFVVFMLASVTMDGLLATTLWVRLETLAFPPTQVRSETLYMAFKTLALVLLPTLFLAIYYGFSFLIRALGGNTARVQEVASAFVYSLVPIALAYQVAHYYTLLLIQGQGIFGLISDPFGWGWNLFGTADHRVSVGVVGAAFVWYSQVALIVAGHVVGVYLAHVIALRVLHNPKRALRSQYPMLALMVLYTVSSLWIISQPIVVEKKGAAAPNVAPNMGAINDVTVPGWRYAGTEGITRGGQGGAQDRPRAGLRPSSGSQSWVLRLKSVVRSKGGHTGIYPGYGEELLYALAQTRSSSLDELCRAGDGRDDRGVWGQPSAGAAGS